jgi:hypothetical protein
VHAVLTRCGLHRLSHVDRVTGEPIRRYEHPHPAICCTSMSRSWATSPTVAAGATSGTPRAVATWLPVGSLWRGSRSRTRPRWRLRRRLSRTHSTPDENASVRVRRRGHRRPRPGVRPG